MVLDEVQHRNQNRRAVLDTFVNHHIEYKDILQEANKDDHQKKIMGKSSP